MIKNYVKEKKSNTCLIKVSKEKKERLGRETIFRNIKKDPQIAES
jgi:hypothetical protein